MNSIWWKRVSVTLFIATLALAITFFGTSARGETFIIDLSSTETIESIISDLNPGETVYIVMKIPNPKNFRITAEVRLLEIICEENEIVEPEQEWYTAHGQVRNDIDSAITFGLWIDRDGDTGGCNTAKGDEWIIDEKAGIHIHNIADTPIPMGTIDPGKTITVVSSYHMDEETENWAQSDTMTYDIKLTREEVPTVAAFSPRRSDTTPPAISRVEAVNVKETEATIRWTTDEPATSQVEYGPTAEYGLAAEDLALFTAHSLTLTGLEPGTTYHYRVASADSAGNRAASDDYSFTTLRPAEFVLSDLTIAPAEIKPEEEVTISLKVTNVGDLEGSTTVELYINDVKEQSKPVTLAGGASTTVSFSVTKTTSGSYTVKVGDLTGSFTVGGVEEPVEVVKPPTPAAFTFTGLVMSPADVVPGAEVTVSVTVKNTGEQSGTYSAELKLDGATKETKTGTLAGGASSTVTFKVSSQTEGIHTVQVGTQTGNFTVTAPQTVSIGLSPGYISGILIIISAAIASIYALYRSGRLPLHNLPKNTP